MPRGSVRTPALADADDGAGEPGAVSRDVSVRMLVTLKSTVVASMDGAGVGVDDGMDMDVALCVVLGGAASMGVRIGGREDWGVVWGGVLEELGGGAGVVCGGSVLECEKGRPAPPRMLESTSGRLTTIVGGLKNGGNRSENGSASSDIRETVA